MGVTGSHIQLASELLSGEEEKVEVIGRLDELKEEEEGEVIERFRGMSIRKVDSPRAVRRRAPQLTSPLLSSDLTEHSSHKSSLDMVAEPPPAWGRVGGKRRSSWEPPEEWNADTIPTWDPLPVLREGSPDLSVSDVGKSAPDKPPRTSLASSK